MSDTYYAIADEDLKSGRPIYVKSNGHIELADADVMPEAGVAGLAIIDAASGDTAAYATDGFLTLSDWSSATNPSSTLLTPGTVYFLVSGYVVGMLTPTPPTSGYVVQIGRALSTTTLEIEIQQSIKL
jgi:hypothetical protein